MSAIFDPLLGKLRTNDGGGGGEGTVVFQGEWDADSNTPTLSDATGTEGEEYVVSVAGTQDLGSGSISYLVGDVIFHNGTAWILKAQVPTLQRAYDKNPVIIVDATGPVQIKPSVADSDYLLQLLNMSDEIKVRMRGDGFIGLNTASDPIFRLQVEDGSGPVAYFRGTDVNPGRVWVDAATGIGSSFILAANQVEKWEMRLNADDVTFELSPGFGGSDPVMQANASGVIFPEEFAHTGGTFGVLGATQAAQQANITNPTGGGVIDAEARTAINSIIAVLETFGFTAV